MQTVAMILARHALANTTAGLRLACRRLSTREIEVQVQRRRGENVGARARVRLSPPVD